MRAGVLVGASIVFALASAAGFRSIDDDPTYWGTIEPVLARSCVPCHQPEGESPFSLATYADAKRRAALIRWVCIVGTMPPMDANSELGTLRALPKVSDQDLIEIQEWVRTGAKEGKSRHRTAIAPLRWRLPDPGLTLRVGQGATVPAEGAPVRRLFVLEDGRLASRALTGFSLRSDAPLALRQAYLFRLNQGESAEELATPLGIRVDRLIGAWSPGHNAWHSPKGFDVDAKGRLAVWALYQPTGKPEPASFNLDLQLADSGVQPTWKTLGNKDFAIKPADGPETLSDEWILEEDRDVISIVPECKLYALQIRVRALLPSGQEKRLLEVLTWDRNWVGAYNFEQPVRLVKGTKLIIEIDYDNSGHSAGNREERPTTSVKFGATDRDEHFWVHFLTIPVVR